MTKIDNVVTEYQYIEDIVGVYTISMLLENKANQLRVKEKTINDLVNYDGDPVFLDKHEWVTIYNFKLHEYLTSPIEVMLVTNGGYVFKADMYELVKYFDKIGYSEKEV